MDNDLPIPDFGGIESGSVVDYEGHMDPMLAAVLLAFAGVMRALIALASKLADK